MTRSLKNEGVITRFAPSPTGNLHIGGARTALFNYLFTQKNMGKMILRLEDTDKERSKKEFEKNILDGLEWLSIKHDQYFKQSERKDVYKKYLVKMLEDNTAYVSKEIQGERKEIIRFRNPNIKLTFSDIIRGEITFDTTELGDFVIAKSIDEPLYHLAVVVDDIEMSITHIIRGEDHISNTPRQILIQKALNATDVHYAHIPMILSPDRSKLSKRHGAVSLTDYRDEGYLSEAMINYLAFLGFNPGGERELYEIDELISVFDLNKVQKGGAIFNKEKLNWYNREYLVKKEDGFFENEIKKIITDIEGGKLPPLIKLIKERATKITDIPKLIKDEFSFIADFEEYEAESLIWKSEEGKIDKKTENTISYLTVMKEKLSNIPNEQFISETIKEKLWDYAIEKGRGEVLWPLRYALTAKKRSPDPFTVAEILGKDETLLRLQRALIRLNEKRK